MLIRCPECQKEISDKAFSCPNCGYPIQQNDFSSEDNRENVLPNDGVFFRNQKEKKKNPITTVLGWTLGIIIFSMLLSDCSNTDETNYYVEEQIETNNLVDENESYEFESEVETEQPETEEIKEEEPIPIFEEYAAECQEFNYKDVLRNPSDYIGKKAKIEIEISSVHEESLFNAGKYYFGCSKDEEYGLYMGDRYCIFDNRYDTSLKLLSDDIIVVYGEIAEPEYTSSIIVNSEELFCIDMKFVELISE